MIMKTVELNIYSYNELSESAKEKARSNYLEHFNFNDHSSDVIDSWLNECNINQYFDYKEAFFSGFYSQGDGAMFEYYNLESGLINEAIDSLDIGQSIKDIMKYYLYISAKGTYRGRYYHEKSVNHNFSIDLEINSDAYPNLCNYIELYTDEIEQYIIDKYEALCGELYSMLRNEYEGLTSEESVEMFYNDNDIMFLEDGTVCNF